LNNFYFVRIFFPPLFQIYSTGRHNTQLSASAIALWVINAIFIAVIVSVTYFIALYDSFNTWDLYSFGTSVFISLVFGLQMKVAFLHNQWNYINVGILLLSISGFYVWIFVVDRAGSLLSAEYYGCGTFALSQQITWQFSTFTIPIFVGVLDLVGQSCYLFFHTPDDLVFRERSMERIIYYLNNFFTCGRANSCKRDGIDDAHAI